MNQILELFLSDALIPVLATFLTVVVGALAKKLVKVIEDKANVEISEKQEKQLDKLVKEGINYAEEQARKAAKGEDTEIDDIFSDKEKVKAAVKYVKERAGEAGFDKVLKQSSEKLARKVEAEIFGKRVEGEKQKAEKKVKEAEDQKDEG